MNYTLSTVLHKLAISLSVDRSHHIKQLLQIIDSPDPVDLDYDAADSDQHNLLDGDDCNSHLDDYPSI